MGGPEPPDTKVSLGISDRETLGTPSIMMAPFFWVGYSKKRHKSLPLGDQQH